MEVVDRPSDHLRHLDCTRVEALGDHPWEHPQEGGPVVGPCSGGADIGARYPVKVVVTEGLRPDALTFSALSYP